MKTVKKMTGIEGIILAAGRGTRMHAVEKNKVMFEIGGKPMLSYPVDALHNLGIDHPIIVVGFSRDGIQAYFGNSVQYAVQEQALGTADAVKAAMKLISDSTEDVIVLYGDHSTFYTAELLSGLVAQHKKNQSAMTLITTHTDPTGYGRILRNKAGVMVGIVEEKNATDEQKKITEINTGNAVYKTSFLRKCLPLIKKDPISGEFYFTDIVRVGGELGEVIDTYVVEDELVGMGVNTPEQLRIAENAMKALGK